MKTIVLYFITLFLFSPGCTSTRNISSEKEILSGKDLHAYGRTIVDGAGALHLITSAAHFGFSFDGSRVQLFVSLTNGASHNYIQYELDGVYQKKIRIERALQQPLTITAPPGKHTVWIYKATEAHTGDIAIQKIAGTNLVPLVRDALPIIEFIGNSITCGAAADASEVPCGQGEYHDQHNAYLAYGPRVARALNTEFVLSSVSGYGIYRTWNRESPSLPAVYDKVDFQPYTTQLWNSKNFTPHIVSIALGTNDISEGDHQSPRNSFDSAIFVSTYVQFVQTIKGKYPKAKVALLSSPMVSGAKGKLLENCLSAVKEQIDRLSAVKKVELFFFEPMQPRGCSYHPSVEDHAIMAEQLIPFFSKLLLDAAKQ